MSTYPEGVFVVSTAGEVKDATGELKLKPVWLFWLVLKAGVGVTEGKMLLFCGGVESPGPGPNDAGWLWKPEGATGPGPNDAGLNDTDGWKADGAAGPGPNDDGWLWKPEGPVIICKKRFKMTESQQIWTNEKNKYLKEQVEECWRWKH